MTNNNKLLYLTVFVAALFVATISGTFAYFQASASNNNVVSGRIADVGITLEVSKLQPKSNVSVAQNGPDLIPFDLMDVPNETLNTSSLTSAISDGCIDVINYTACDVFKIKVKANNTLKIDGYIKIEAGDNNSSIPNVKWMLLKQRIDAPASDDDDQYTNIAYLDGKLTSSYLTYTNVKPIGAPSALETTKGNTTDGYYFTNLSSNDQTIYTTYSYYFFIVWLEDINELQDDEGIYKGTVTFRAHGDSEGKVTANFSS